MAGLRSGQREVHAPADRPRLSREGQEVHRRLRPLAGQDGRVWSVPGRVGLEGHHVPGGGAGRAARVGVAAQGPFFTKPGWYKPIHDHTENPIHGHIDYIKALAVSCNVYFGQLGLALGPDAFINLVKDGVEIGWNGKVISPGKPGSRELAETAFGQAAALVSVSQLARVGGTVASGGIYRKCGPGMELGPPCEERKILAQPGLAVPILSGMEQVVQAGTARGLVKPPGIRIYGKTGTADAIGTKDEIVFGVPYNEWGTPNSWFLGIAEDEHAEPDQASFPHRIVAAVVVPRGGLGARVSGPAAMEVLAAVQSLGYITPKAAAQPGAPAAPGAPTGSPGPGAPGGKAPLTVVSPVLATPTPSVPSPAARPSSAVSPVPTRPAAGAPSGASVSPAPTVSPRPAPPPTTPRPPAATTTPRPSPPAAPPSPSPPAQVP
ncbi:MAG: hypothetical protein DMF77_09380 [Acidobacteria bacterium]|nr:MAG: hypothetical protein DMF77_09380 [Acidobacteriota bacterium]